MRMEGAGQAVGHGGWGWGLVWQEGRQMQDLARPQVLLRRGISCIVESVEVSQIIGHSLNFGPQSLSRSFDILSIT